MSGLGKRLLVFIVINIIGIIDIFRGILGKDPVPLYLGLFLCAIGINFSIFSLPCLVVLITSVIIAIFVQPWIIAISVGVALISAWTAYCLIVDYKMVAKSDDTKL